MITIYTNLLRSVVSCSSTVKVPRKQHIYIQGQLKLESSKRKERSRVGRGVECIYITAAKKRLFLDFTSTSTLFKWLTLCHVHLLLHYTLNINMPLISLFILFTYLFNVFLQSYPITNKENNL